MNLRINLLLLSTVLVLSYGCEKVENEEDKINDKTKGYQEAFNKHDAKTLASFFAEEGIYTNPESGNPIQGKANIEQAFEDQFKGTGNAKIDVKVNTITFPSKENAIQVGTFLIKQPGQEPVESAFKAYFEKKDGKWLIVEIREIDIADAPNQYQHLKDLEWLVGNWIDADDDVEINSTFSWDKSKNFLYDNFSVVTEGTLELEGLQIIGWDPIEKKIRSWIFDSDGGFGDATWMKKDNHWVVETAQTLADGSRASSISVYTPIDANSYTWESTGREVGGKILPDIAPMKIIKS